MPNKAIFARDYGFFAIVLSYMDKDMLARGKYKFLLKLPWNVLYKVPKNFLLA